MTQDEIIEMAREAGLDPDLWNYTDAFEAFAKLVDAKATAREREACAKVCDEDQTQAMDWMGTAYVGKYYGQLLRNRGDL